MQSYDAIVLGVGGVGSAALWRLAARGLRVLGIDQFTPPHDQGSSHGQSRIIRQAYFEHPDYVPLLKHAYTMWGELARHAGYPLMLPTGLVQIGPTHGAVLAGVRRAAQQHGLAIEELSAAEIVHRWPAFSVPDGMTGVFEAAGGLLYVERCVRACIEAAERHGAHCWWNTPAVAWRAEGQGVVVDTDRGAVAADRLVIAAGPWAARVLQALRLPLQIRRASLFWFEADARHAPEQMPAYLFDLPEGVYYGFPRLDTRGVKVSDHAGGTLLRSPQEIDRGLDPRDQAALRAFLQQCLPGVGSRPTDHTTCYYTLTPDQHFLVDRHPLHPHVAFAAGLSGHGFKFTPVLGQALADLAVDGASTLPIEFLRLARLG